jgi:hypothetical protein
VDPAALAFLPRPASRPLRPRPGIPVRSGLRNSLRLPLTGVTPRSRRPTAVRETRIAVPRNPFRHPLSYPHRSRQTSGGVLAREP